MSGFSTTIGPNSSSCSARTSRRRTSSSVARNVTAASVRDRQRRGSSGAARGRPASGLQDGDLLADRDLAGDDLRWRRRRFRNRRELEGSGEDVRGHRRRCRLGKVGLARLAAYRGDAITPPELGGRVTQRAVLEQPPAAPPRPALGAVRQRRKRLGRQHPLRLQEDELRGDRDELAERGGVDGVLVRCST